MLVRARLLALAAAHEGEPLEQVSVLLVLDQGARERGDELARVALAQRLRRDVLVQQQREVAQQIEAMRQSNRVIFNRPDGAAKSPWLVELNADRILAAEMGVRRPPQTFPSAAEFLTWVGGRNSGAIYFVILVKPDSIEIFETLRQELQDRQFEVGYDLLRADQTAIDPNTGAGTP